MDQQDARPVAYLTSGIFGYLYRFFPIGRALLARGHSVVVVTASSDAAAHAAAAGFDVRHLARQEAALAALETPKWGKLTRPLARRLPGVSLGPRAASRAHWAAKAAVLRDSSELECRLEELDPKLVLVDAEEHRDIRIALAAGLDLMLFEDLYSVRPGRDVPFPGRSHHVPTGGPLSRLRASVSWRQFLVGSAVRRRAERWWVGGNDWHSVLAELGQRARLDETSVDSRYFQFYDYVLLPRLRTVAPELAFPGEPQPETIIGPIVDLQREVHDVDEAFAQQWLHVIERRQRGARVIYVSLGTFLAGMSELTERIVEATSDLPDVELVVSVGRDHPLWEARELPSNVAVYERVPQMDVLANADLVISTGGLNTGHEALWFGVPILNLPVAGLDTPGNAARLTYHGVGRRLTARRATVDNIRAEVQLLLEEPTHRQNAQRMSRQLRAQDAVASAVDRIEKGLG